MNSTIKLGQMQPDYGSLMSQSSKDEKENLVERFPCVYINNDDLPELKVGDEVILKGVIIDYGEQERRVKEDDKTSIEQKRNCEVEVREMTVTSKKAETLPKSSDEEDIAKGLDKATESDEENPEEDEE